MNLADILVLALVAGAVWGAVHTLRKTRRTGRSCGCGCPDCDAGCAKAKKRS